MILSYCPTCRVSHSSAFQLRACPTCGGAINRGVANVVDEKRQRLTDLRTVIGLGEETVAHMSEDDAIALDDGRMVDRDDIEAETQRVMDALAQLAFAPVRIKT